MTNNKPNDNNNSHSSMSINNLLGGGGGKLIGNPISKRKRERVLVCVYLINVNVLCAYGSNPFFRFFSVDTGKSDDPAFGTCPLLPLSFLFIFSFVLPSTSYHLLLVQTADLSYTDMFNSNNNSNNAIPMTVSQQKEIL